MLAENDSGILAQRALLLALFGDYIGSMIGLADLRSRSPELCPRLSGAAFSGSGRSNPSSLSSMSRPRCALAPRLSLVQPLVLTGQTVPKEGIARPPVPKLSESQITGVAHGAL